MNEITCDICMDLMPLIIDGVASEDSTKAVLHHLEHCESCKSFYEKQDTIEIQDTKMVNKIQSKLKIYYLLIIMLGILLGLSLNDGPNIFLNFLLLPLVGAVTFFAYRFKSLYIAPLIVLASILINYFYTFLVFNKIIGLGDLCYWMAIFTLFVYLGVLIAGLLNFAFRKDNL